MHKLWVATFFAMTLLLSQADPGRSQEQDNLRLPEPVQSETEHQKILFLNTFQIGLPIPDSIDRGVLAGLKESGRSNNDIFLEHLDFAREQGREYREKTAEMLRRKFAGKDVGVVIAEGSPVIDFLTTEAKDLFPDAALLTLITPIIDTSLTDSRKVIEIPWRVDLAGTLSVAIDLFPQTRRVVVVTGAHDNVLPVLEEAQRTFTLWTGRLDFEFTDKMTLEQMLQHVSSLPPDAIIIYSPFFIDTTGRSFVPAEVQAAVSRSANVPVFATLEAYLGHGVVGGSLLKTEAIGQQAVKLALSYLDGNLNLKKAITTFNTPTQMMFDWKELTRWKAKTSALPEDSIVINRPPTFYGQYKGLVITASVGFFIMSILILTLWTLNRQLKRLTLSVGDSEARFRVMMEHAPEAIIVYDPGSKKIIDANPRAAQLFCCTLQALFQADPERFYQSDETTGTDIADLHKEALAGAEVRFEFILRTCDGTKRDCEIRLVKLPFQGQELIRASFIDITERKRAEEEMRKSEAHLRTLVQTIPDLIWLKDKDGVYLSCNSRFERFFGATQAEIVGKTDYDFVDKELADFFIAHDRKAMAAEKPSSNEEWITFADDGHRALLETIKTPMFDDTGTLVGVLGIGRDITERKRAEEEKSKLEMQLQQAQRIEAIGQLAGGVAHDFNNMLGVILGHTEMMMEELQPSQAIYKDLKQIEVAAKRSADITRQLLAFARKQTIAPKSIDLNETVESMLKMLRRLIGEDIELIWLPGSSLWQVRMDPSQIDQILANLCVNARGAIDGVGTITVGTGKITLDEEYCSAHMGFVPGDYVRLTVSDNGCGMSKETMAHIFEPFFTTKAVGKGTGLGLATVYGAVKQNKGFINVYSEVGRGTTFTIYLPRHQGEDGQDEYQEGSKRVLGGNETILLVEDEPTILAMARSMLQRLGYKVLAATSPGEAIRMASDFSGRIDLLITDVIMPEMNGRDLAANMVAKKPDMKCLFMSGYTADIINKHGVIEENLCFIQKPFSKMELAGKIREVIDRPRSIS